MELSPNCTGEGVTSQRGGRTSPASAGSNVQLVPTKPGELLSQSAQYDSSEQGGEDLMMFSISPLVAQNARKTAGKEFSPKPAVKSDSSVPDLMAFSNSPMQAQIRRSIHPPPHEPSSALPISNTSGLMSHSHLNPTREMSPSTEATGGKFLRTSQPNDLTTSQWVNQFGTQPPQPQTRATQPPQPQTRATQPPQPQTRATQPPHPGNQDMLAEDLITFSISPINFSKATAKYGDEGVNEDRSSISKLQNLKTYGSAPSSEPVQLVSSHASPMKYAPLSHLTKFGQSDPQLSKPTGLQSMQSQPHAQQLAVFSSTGRHPHFGTPTSGQFPSHAATTSADQGGNKQNTRPYGMWEKFESNAPSPAITRIPQSSGKEGQTLEFQHPRPDLRLSTPPPPLPSLSQPQQSNVISQPQVHTPHSHTTLTQLGSAQKSRSLPNDGRRQGSHHVMSYAAGATSAPLVATRYNHQPQSYPSSSSGKRESSELPAGLTNRDITVPSPVGANTLNERSRNVHRPVGMQSSSNQSRLSPHSDPTYASVDECPGDNLRGLEMQETRQDGHKPPPVSISEKNATTTGMQVAWLIRYTESISKKGCTLPWSALLCQTRPWINHIVWYTLPY